MTRTYGGGELRMFAAATNWKRYFGSVLRPFIAGRVLDVGAGIGSNISYLLNNRVVEWTSLEPDPELAQLSKRQALEEHCHRAAGLL